MVSSERSPSAGQIECPVNMHRKLGLVLMYALKNVCRASFQRAAFVQRSKTCSVVTSSVVALDRASVATARCRANDGSAVLRRGLQSTHKSRSLGEIRRYSTSQDSIFSEDPDFAALNVRTDILLRRLGRMGLERPTAVQSAAYREIRESHNNVTIGAETGSGKVGKMISALLFTSFDVSNTYTPTHFCRRWPIYCL